MYNETRGLVNNTVMAKIKKTSLILASLLTASCNYTNLSCSEAEFADSLKECKVYKCSKPLVGASFSVTPGNNSLCEVSVGFYKNNEYMSCQAGTNEFKSVQTIITNWSMANTEKQAQFNLKELEIEYFIDNNSIGKPFSNLVSQNKCKYEKTP